MVQRIGHIRTLSRFMNSTTFRQSRYAIISIIILVILTCLAAYLHLYRIDAPCLNEDEAAQGYNTYSVWKTGLDEYGLLPIRYLSFGENKLPLTGMLSLPFIMIGGLNMLTVRAPTHLIGIAFPLLFFFASYALTRRRIPALITAYFAATNVWLHTLARHQHDAVVLAAFVLISITVLFGTRQLLNRHLIILSVLTFCSLYTYHSAKLIMPVLALCAIGMYIWQSKATMRSRINRALIATGIMMIALGLFAYSEYLVPNTRVATLSFFTSPAFIHEIEEGRRLGGSSIFYNKPVYGSYRLMTRTLGYLSPDFLLFRSDPNPRYGTPYIPLLTWVEYALFVSGLIFASARALITRKKQHVWFLTAAVSACVLMILPASLALPEYSSTRAFLLCIPFLIIIGSVSAHMLEVVRKVHKGIALGVIVVIMIVHSGMQMRTWRSYFDIYLTDPRTHESWQCGMRSVAEYAWKNHNFYDRISISRRLGQPYIFLLFYGGPYPPERYQKIAKRMPRNEYGFWEQDQFDIFDFTTDLETSTNSLIIIHRSELSDNDIQKYNLFTLNREKTFYAPR